MSQDPAPPKHDDQPEVISRNARYGLVLFIAYTLIYAGFVGLSAFAPRAMAMPVLAGVNLAVVYGFGLIVLALVLALVYMYLCSLRRDNGGRR